MEGSITYTIADDKATLAMAKDLIMQYIAELQEDLSAQNIDRELATLDQLYTAPKGSLILAFINNHSTPAGCVALKFLEPGIAEIKRLYVSPSFRGTGLGKGLLLQAILAAKSLAYKKVRLDSLGKLKAAIKLYQENGFYEIPPYWHNPLDGVVYLEKVL